MSLLETSGLGKDYGTLKAVDSLDLQLQQGETFGLLGPNGAGKTTVISMICGVLTPTRGAVRVDGHDIRKDYYEARRILGLAPQDLAIYEDLTALENLRFFGRMAGLKGTDRDDAVTWALDVAGLADRASDLVSKYSGGMKRRLNLAAGIMHRPRLLVLDEPTVGVDPQSRAHIFDTVRGLTKEHGMTVLYTSHYMEEVEDLCSRVGIMDHGKLIALDTVQDLIAHHAPGAVEVSFEGDGDQVEQALKSIGPVNRVDGSYRVQTQDAVGDIVRAVEGQGARITALSIMAADLETVFLSLTGRSLRDQA